MASTAVEQRRDPRYQLKADFASAEFDDPAAPETHLCAQLTSLSAAGITLVVDTRLELQDETILRDVTLRVGHCHIAGSFVVKNVIPLDDVRSQLGGLFYPGTESESSRLMALIAGMEAVESSS